jgi:hypothetical protein
MGSTRKLQHPVQSKGPPGGGKRMERTITREHAKKSKYLSISFIAITGFNDSSFLKIYLSHVEKKSF